MVPDVAPMQEAMLEQMQERMMANVTSMQPDEMMKTWLPIGIASWSELQKAFWTQMTPGGKQSDDNS